MHWLPNKLRGVHVGPKPEGMAAEHNDNAGLQLQMLQVSFLHRRCIADDCTWRARASSTSQQSQQASECSVAVSAGFRQRTSPSTYFLFLAFCWLPWTLQLCNGMLA